jgi:hypothetical protein
MTPGAQILVLTLAKPSTSKGEFWQCQTALLLCKTGEELAIHRDPSHPTLTAEVDAATANDTLRGQTVTGVPPMHSTSTLETPTGVSNVSALELQRIVTAPPGTELRSDSNLVLMLKG